MPEDPNIPLRVAEPKLPLPAFLCWLGANASAFLNWIGSHLSVDGRIVGEAVFAVRQIEEPAAADRDKVWIDPRSPYSFKFFADGAWQGVYSLQPGTMSFVARNEPLPRGFRYLTDDEVEQMGLPDEHEGGEVGGATIGFRYTIFEPEN